MADLEPLADALSRSFADDPVMEFIYPERNRINRIRSFFHHELRHHYLRDDETWTTTDAVLGGALWSPPGKWRHSWIDVLRMMPRQVPALGRNLVRGLSALNGVEAAHPPGDHYYLGVLGTDPSAQGKGLGSACLEPVLRRCDEEGMGAYLESSKEKNVPFYNRHGFEVTRELPLAGGGPSVWLMWREPKPDRA
jgi:GNAT superfamily N-acetyltransferase